jgi:L-lactate dehydrogenase (cytochrome)
MPVITNIEDLRILAERRVPRMFYDYADSGSWSEATYRANSADFARIGLRQKVAVNFEGRSTAGNMMGESLAMPVVLAPVGSTGMQSADGEIHACRAAHAFGTQFTLSTMSVCSIEQVAAKAEKPFWFQVYIMRDRAFAGKLIDRAKAAGCSALVLTLDLQILAQRHKDLKNGLSVPPRLTPRTLANMLTKWRWCLGMLGTRNRNFGNIVGHVEGVTDIAKLSVWAHEMFDPTLNWDDIAWIRDRWSGKLILKGIQDEDDARRAATTGADALIVSNHGGRQLDGALSSIEALPGIASAVGDKIDVFMDGGIRSGQDVMKALALGARGTFIGRAFIYGLGAMGGPGVTRALEIIRRELDVSMALCGHRSIGEIGPKTVILPRERAKMALGTG